MCETTMAEFKPSILPDTAFHPGGFLREELEARGLSLDALATSMQRPAEEVYAVVNEQAMITEEFAQELERVLNVSAQSWLNLVTMYHLVLENGGKPEVPLAAADLADEEATDMQLLFRTPDLRRCFESGSRAEAQWGRPAGRQYVGVLARMASVERWSDLRRLPDFRSRRFKRLEGDRQADYSLRLTRNWRLIVRPGDTEREIEIRNVENHYGD